QDSEIVNHTVRSKLHGNNLHKSQRIWYTCIVNSGFADIGRSDNIHALDFSQLPISVKSNIDIPRMRTAIQ
ncbi:hypothetical protein ABEB36_005611, partial [Hypothenemus hampei]